MERHDFFEAVAMQSEKLNSRYTDCISDRRKLAEFLEMNGWFGVAGRLPEDREKIPVKKVALFMRQKDIKIIQKHLELWLSAYKKSSCEKLMLLAGYGREILPETTEAYLCFIEKTEQAEKQYSWQLLDYLLSSLEEEILEVSAEKTEELLSRMDNELPLTLAQLFTEFYEYLRKEKGENGWIYRFSSRTVQKDNEAYPVRGFSSMAYCIFNDSYWREGALLKKACESPMFANLWAFLAMHFVCALRSTDIERLPMPELPCSGTEFRDMVQQNQVKNPETFARDMQIRLRYKAIRPYKTLMYSNVPEVKLFVPTSLEKPLGIILAVAASYCADKKVGEGFIKACRSISIIRSFFGKAFSDALHGKNFSSRRVNKAYLQGIELVAGTDETAAPKGYMLAALARSHKGGVGTLPDVTEVYLKDAAFSRYTPEFIAREMFERGVFGFIPHLLLATYGGGEYSRLSVADQTSLIQKIGISASGIEELIRLNDRTMIKAKETVGLQRLEKKELQDILQKIASGNAVGKQDGMLCMMAACGFSCSYPDRTACIGCRYEIYTKAVLHQMVSEYARLHSLCTKDDGWRYKKIIRGTVLPMIGEFLETIRILYPNADMEILTEIMEGGMEGYDGSGEPDSGRELQQVSSSQKYG